MKLNMSVLTLTSLGILLAAVPAYADDITVCADKAEGDECTQEDGEIGVCDLDAETQQLKCSDNGLTEDQMVCLDKAVGDDCTLSDGEPGTCEEDDAGQVLACSSIDEPDADVVACEDKSDDDECTQSDGEIGVCKTNDGVRACSDNGLDADNTDCLDKEEDDTCTTDADTDGVCTPDEDSGVLECSEINSDASDDGCSASSAPFKTGGTFMALAIGALALVRRKRTAR
jgi:MYXO-CTERM domain-containing protein